LIDYTAFLSIASANRYLASNGTTAKSRIIAVAEPIRSAIKACRVEHEINSHLGIMSSISLFSSHSLLVLAVSLQLVSGTQARIVYYDGNLTEEERARRRRLGQIIGGSVASGS
jgi:hypothetical protein